MGNHHSASHAALKPRKNVHWKSAGRPSAPGKPDIVPIPSDEEPNAVTLRWSAATHDGGAPLLGYRVECNRLGTPAWVRTAPPLVLRPELVLTGLEPPHRYQFRVAAVNAVGRSDYGELSDVLTVGADRARNEPPTFLRRLDDVTALENDKTEFRVEYTGAPAPTVAWFKDDYEIFSSRRTAITTTDTSSVLVFYQTLASDEGEIKCTATNRVGHAVTRARLALEAAPKLRYPRQYEDGLLYEINETIFLKTSIVGKPTPTVEWLHDGWPIVAADRVHISNTPKFSTLKIQRARRSDRGEYQVHARNAIGEDTAAFLVTVTAPPDPPRSVRVVRQLDKSVTLDWEPPEDDGGCRIGNYVVEYYRTGWDVWLKATAGRTASVTLFDLIEGGEYRFRVKAESPYGMSAPSAESAAVRIPGRPLDMDYLTAESRIIGQALAASEAERTVSPAPRRRRSPAASPAPGAPLATPSSPTASSALSTPAASSAPYLTPASSPQVRSADRAGSNEFMLVLYPDNRRSSDKAEKRRSFQLELEDALSPPPLSLSAPELSARCTSPLRTLRNAVSSTELLHERAMARFYEAVAMQEEQSGSRSATPATKRAQDAVGLHETLRETTTPALSDAPQIYIQSDSIENKEYKYSSRQPSQDSVTSDSKRPRRRNPRQVSLDSENSDGRWQSMSFDEDYTASTVSTDGDYSDEGSLDGDADGRNQMSDEEETYNPRDKFARRSPLNEDTPGKEHDDADMEILKPLPDPNFVPKPILKRREPATATTKQYQDTSKSEEMITSDEPPKKEEKMNLFKKFTKMPIQKPFPFPKILSKKEPEKPMKETLSNNAAKTSPKKADDRISEEGRTVIDYYGSILKEYGSQKRPTTPLYLSTDDLKSVAEKQQQERKAKTVKSKKPPKGKVKKSALTKSSDKQVPAKTPSPTPGEPKQRATRAVVVKKRPEQERPTTPKLNKALENYNQQVLLKTAERATIVIPIDYKKLEEKAKVNVRTAIDYMVDLCLLVLAFWLYLFKDERLAIPFLILIIYRQLQETLLQEVPEWVDRHTPSWLKKKTS